MIGISKREDGLYWPNIDVDACYSWTQVEISSVEHIIRSCSSLRSIIHAGANIGAYSLKFSAAFENVYAFEPDRTNFKCLSLNTIEVDNIWTICSALGSKSGNVSLMNHDSNNCGTHFVAGSGHALMISIDDLNLQDVDCIHLDVEGYELFALQGAMRTIQISNPLIVVEWLDHGQKYGHNQQDILSFLSQCGYHQMKKVGSDMMFKR
jgi:FkbM family methyltransferase